MGAWTFCVLSGRDFLHENLHAHIRSLVLGRGILIFLFFWGGGGGSANLIFVCAWILLIHIPLYRKNVRTPTTTTSSKKYRSTPPICITIRLQFALQYFWCPSALRKGKYCQYASHFYRSTRPICIAIRLPFVSQYFSENLGGCGRWNI